MDLLVFVLVSVLVILTLVLVLRRRLRKLAENPDADFRKSLSSPERNYDMIKWFFIISGAGSVINGALQAYGSITGRGEIFQIRDAVLNASLGIIFLICLWFTIKRNKIVLWIYGFAILVSIVYSFVVGRGFNYLMAIFGALIMYQLVKLVKANELH